jgi:hypothetical protein
VASNYPKIIVSTPQSGSSTPRPKKTFVSFFVPSTTCNDDCTSALKSMPERMYDLCASPFVARQIHVVIIKLGVIKCMVPVA